MLSIREEEPGDINALTRVHQAAFGRSDEGELVARLRENDQLSISLVATVGEHPVGHIAFSPVQPAIAGIQAPPLALGPVGIDPEHERRGIASRLVQAGLEKAEALGTPYVVVLGDPTFYGRLGFEPINKHELQGDYPADEAFRILVLSKGKLPPAGSHIQYVPAFEGLPT
ncbi:putative acetyltransferase [Natronospira proteinivora]|uniref:Acetyltransferase n=1 Tax=Natronospira proteinivora TaxID=1807133 RepID=A0ABT1G9T3_9GAMM|nr:N-acetyltransferase [Natronospira proteinivora]MCP1728049.1 putative acetyltransferase [Natronospira proteinivora]